MLPARLEKGRQAEKKVGKALGEMKKRGDIIEFVDTTDTDLDKRGVDFVVITDDNTQKVIPLQVKSSKRGAVEHKRITEEIFQSGAFRDITMTVFIPGIGYKRVHMDKKIPVVTVFKRYRCYEVMQEVSRAINELA